MDRGEDSGRASGRLGRLTGIHTMSYKGWLTSPRLAFEVVERA